MRNLILGIDLGTSGVRAAIFDATLRELGCGYYEYPLISLSGGYVEQDAEDWWRLTSVAVKDALIQSGASAECVKAIGVSTQGISIVPVDRNFHPMANAVSWLDLRAKEQMEYLLSECGAERLYSVTGKRPNASYTLPKLMWLKENKRELYDSCYKLLTPLDYITARMTGLAVTDHTSAGGTMAYDIKKHEWSQEMLELSGISKDKLPEINWAGEIVGCLTEQAAAELGLDIGAVVYTGAQDQKCAAYAAGLSHGVVALSIGTAAALTVKCANMPENTDFACFNYLSPGEMVLEGVIPTAGMALRWLRDKFAQGMSYPDIDAAASAARFDNEVIFIPHLSGEGSPNWRNEVKGSFHYMTLETGIGNMACAVMEGVAFEITRNLHAMEHMGVMTNEIRAFGGGAKSKLWMQIIADCTGKRVTKTPVVECACLGASMIASGASVSTGQETVFEPEEKRRARYVAMYKRYLSICAI